MHNYDEVNLTVPRYQQIAVDIASKIAEGYHPEGTKINACSALAGQYAVSPETARRAICVLVDLEIVTSEKGSGITVLSYQNAVMFIKQYKDVRTINEIKEKMLESVKLQNEEMEHLSGYLKELLSRIENLRSVNPFIPYQITVSKDTPYLNKTVGDIRFWQQTAATIVALKHKNKLMVSPGPYAVLCENDVIFFIGEDSVQERVKGFLYPQQ